MVCSPKIWDLNVRFFVRKTGCTSQLDNAWISTVLDSKFFYIELQMQKQNYQKPSSQYYNEQLENMFLCNTALVGYSSWQIFLAQPLA